MTSKYVKPQKIAFFIVALLLLLLWARRPDVGEVPYSETSFLMDTLITITVSGVAEETAQRSVSEAFDKMRSVDEEMGRRDGTALDRLNKSGGGDLSQTMAAVIASAISWAEASGGAFDPTVAPLLDLWRVKDGPHPPPSGENLSGAVEKTGYKALVLASDGKSIELNGRMLDLGGVAKGYAIDLAVKALKKAGVENFIVNAGGDLYVSGMKGERPWRVGIAHPRSPGELFAIVEPSDSAMVTSGDYERYFMWEEKRYHHIIDPKTGYPAGGVSSVTVTARSAMDADALATAVFILGEERGIAFLEGIDGAEGMVINASGDAMKSSGFNRAAPEASNK
ncbi:MAG: hypothetical protein C0608_05225 [Deltaproteobacteria bacterium]|nr:MAG: hypothetical protein C0608_05225 [Deltaproteobacteria bacterium]